jgi:hypothetical protein
VRDPIVSFELLELEMADLEHFWRETPLGPLGVKVIIIIIIKYLTPFCILELQE